MKRKIAAIDIGTTKVCTIMGTLDSSSGLRILGVGVAPSRGIEKGLVFNVNLARESIHQSIKKAEMMAGGKIDSAFIGVSGKHISSIHKKGSVAINNATQKVTPDDLRRAINVALDIKTPAERKDLHILPKYTLDGQTVKDPVGMHGYQLNVETAVASVQNLTKCVQGVGIEVEDLILDPLASAEAVLTDEEKQTGVMVMDIGGGTTDIVVMKNNEMHYTSVLPVGGNQITMDIAAGFGLPVEMAEKVKINLKTAANDDNTDTQDDGGGNISASDLMDVINTRVEEMIRLAMLEIEGESIPDLIPSGLVITGGSANLPGIAELAQAIIRLPARIGVPPSITGLDDATLADPAFATSFGLLLWKMKDAKLFQPKGIRAALSPLVELFR
jgi:cell division protein FtsA